MLFRSQLVVLCGSRRVTVARLGRSRHRLQLVSLARVRLHVADSHDDSWLAEIARVLPELRADGDRNADVVVVLPASETLLKFIRVPAVARAAREKIIRFEATQALPVALTDLAWDAAPAGGDRVLIAAARLARVEELCRVFAAAGFTVTRVLPTVLPTLAGFRQLEKFTATESPVLVTTEASEALVLQLTNESRVAARGIRLRPAACAMGTAGTTPRITAREGRDPGALAEEIRRSATSFQRDHELPRPQRIFFTAEDEHLAEEIKRTANILDAPIEEVDGRELHLHAASGTISTVPSGDELLQFAGLAAGRAAGVPDDFDLLPAERARRLAHVRRRSWLAAAGIMILLAGLPLAWRFHRDGDLFRRQAAAVERELGPLRRHAADIRTNRLRLDDAQNRLAVAAAIEKRRSAWLEILADLEHRLAQLDGLRLDRLRTLPDRGQKVRLSLGGILGGEASLDAAASADEANRVSALVAALLESPFADAVEGERIERGPDGRSQFTLVLVLRERVSAP